MKLNCFLAYLLMSDNANLLDITEGGKAGRLVCYFLVESAVRV